MSTTLFKQVRIFDGSGSAPFDGHVLIDGERFACVRPGLPAGDVTADRTIDGKGATLMPGLIDVHAHLSLASTTTHISKPGDYPDAQAALLIAHAGRAMLDAGFTSGFSGGSASPVAEVAAKAAFEAGLLPGPRLRTCSFERTPGGPMGLRVTFGGARSRKPDVDGAVAFVHEMKSAGVDSVKFLLNGVSAFDPGTNRSEQFHDAEVEAAAAAAIADGLDLVAHCYTAQSIRLAVRTGFRVLYHCNYADDAALDAIESRKDSIFIGPTPGIVEADLLRAPKFGVMASPEQRREQEDLVQTVKAMGQRMRQRGFKVLPGGDYGFPWNPIGRNARDLTLFVDWFGYSPTETLIAATRLGGEVMHRANDLGCIKEGYLADCLLVAGDPTRDISVLEQSSNLLAIVSNGRLHKAPLAN